MADLVIDETSEGFKLGLEIGKIKERIVELPLEDLIREADTWESITPLMDPTLYMTHRAAMADFIKNLRILLTAKEAFLQEQVEIN